MRPFGMRGSRLVSDILTDAKVSALEKQNAWVLVYRGDIVWVVGVRCSCCFAVTPESREVVRIALG
ncbi:MAG: tRNA lysidine(34) synthetase TilS [Muribaculaceae bacterium]